MGVLLQACIIQHDCKFGVQSLLINGVGAAIHPTHIVIAKFDRYFVNCFNGVRMPLVALYMRNALSAMHTFMYCCFMIIVNMPVAALPK